MPEGLTQFIRVSVQGVLVGGEKWSVNPVYWAFSWPGSAWGYESFQAMTERVAAVNVPSGLTNLMSNQAGVTSIRCDGYSLEETLQETASAPLATPESGSGAPTTPRTTAVVLSLRTGAAGASARGRLYWPTLQLPLESTTANISPVVQQTIAEAANEYLSAIEDAINVDELPGLRYVLAVWSRTKHSARAVTNIMVGNQPDSQRRRKDAIVENYFSTSYTGA
uniref:Uncharacterized protein n=1 Tax=uncultured prokaryote TaxID=198431 RepID=A0A0H5QD95_9ZZZZ|nr:hypothetical protein [uncultured prokaryote]